MNKLLSIMVSAALASSSAVALADSSKEKFSLKDPGVINKERILYWMIKRGDLRADATDAQKEQAVNEYIGGALKGYQQPEFLAKLELSAKKRQKALTKTSMTTNVKVLSVLVDFPDLPYDNNGLSSSDTSMYYSDYNLQHYQDLQFSTNGYTGPSGQTLESGYQFFQQESGGTFFFTGNTFGWVTADNNGAFYGENDPDDNDNDKNASGLVAEAVQKAVTANNIDLSEYDVEDPYDRDQDGNLNEPDGFIDHIMIYHSSIGEEAGGGQLGDDAIWSHRFVINQTGSFETMGEAIEDGSCGSQQNPCMRAFGYTIQPIDAAAGVVVHEFGHDLGLRDEYDVDYGAEGSPVGYWSVMASGSYTGNPAGSVPVGYSPLAREFFQDKFGGDWIDQVVIELTDLENGNQTHQLFEAVDHTSPLNQLRVNLPLQQVGPYSGSWNYYSGEGHNLSNQMSFDVTLPSASSIELSMKAHWDIEKDWDHVMVKVNGTPVAGNHTNATNPYTGSYNGQYEGVINYITDKSSLIAGAEGIAGWIDLTFDLSSYSGEAVTIEFLYTTDSNTGGYGFVADQLLITADSATVLNDGAEQSGTVSSNGFIRSDSSIVVGDQQSYYIQQRSHNGVDAGLSSRNYQSGTVVWLRNDGYTDNRVGDHPGYGFIGVVDANQNFIAGGSTSTQIRDAAFQLNGQSLFDDSNDYSHPQQPSSGLVLPVHGFQMELVSEAADRSQSTIELSKQALILTSSFNINVTDLTISLSNNSFGGDGNLSYAWDFGDGNSSTGFAPTHTYAEAGDYTVSLTITDQSNNTHTSSKTATVSEPATVAISANFSVTTNDLTANFTNSSSGGSGTLSYSWDFGDGSSSTATSPSHTYSAAGSYTVELTVTDSQSNVETTTRTVTVSEPVSDGGGSGGGSLPVTLLLGLSSLIWLRRKA
jgi:immune inhibitor A